jgi:hypothetical protein
VLLEALAAVNRPCSVRLEGDLGLLSTLGAGYIGHLSGSAIETSTAASTASAATAATVLSLEHLIHFPFVSIQGIEPATKNISTKSIESTQM